MKASPNTSHITRYPSTTHETHHLRLPPTLHQRLPSCILPHRLHIIRRATRQAAETQRPERQANREGDLLLDCRRLILEVEGDDDGDADDRHIDGEAQPGEERPLVGAVVARVGGDVGEEERGEEWKGMWVVGVGGAGGD